MLLKHNRASLMTHTSGDLQNIVDDLKPGQDLLSCRDGMDRPPAGGLGQEEVQGRFTTLLLADHQVDAGIPAEPVEQLLGGAYV
jgi:hypothetical protein